MHLEFYNVNFHFRDIEKILRGHLQTLDIIYSDGLGKSDLEDLADFCPQNLTSLTLNAVRCSQDDGNSENCKVLALHKVKRMLPHLLCSVDGNLLGSAACRYCHK